MTSRLPSGELDEVRPTAGLRHHGATGDDDALYRRSFAAYPVARILLCQGIRAAPRAKDIERFHGLRANHSGTVRNIGCDNGDLSRSHDKTLVGYGKFNLPRYHERDLLFRVLMNGKVRARSVNVTNYRLL